jgi:hypothetical protein
MATQWTAGLTDNTTLPAATLNSIGAAWESYTPVIKGGATTVSATITYAKYVQIQKFVFVQVRAIVTSAGAVNGYISISLPTGLNAVTDSSTRVIGNFFVLDAGTAFYHGAAIASLSTTVQGVANNSVDYIGGSSPSMTLANNDIVAMSVCYEVA